ncbi:MAG: FAD-dependent monooxygenase [Bacteroidales bacterium]|nr:FAD-dependent monooxygenase [Bacteroidales bacterium]
MGYKEIELKVPVSLPEPDLEHYLRKKSGLRDFSFQILRKSLDARNKSNIYWQYRIGFQSSELKSGVKPQAETLVPEFRPRDKQVVIAGTGPAGIFAALFLLKSGFRVSLLERGSRVEKRLESVRNFEKTGNLDRANNYAFGEGGAGTFSDGKLTSRTKSISPERNFIFSELIRHGAPEEIHYMTHPHLGTDNLYRITQNLRKELLELGCQILFDHQLTEVEVSSGSIESCDTPTGRIEADYFILATGHSSYDTYRMLIRKGVAFRPKNFAIGFRAEHLQEVINRAQWGCAKLPNVKAAEYRLTSSTPDNTPVYSFCMCPGGKVVPATAYPHTSVVNGMSYYKRDSKWANAAIVAGINLEKMLGKEVSAEEALFWLEKLEASYFDLYSNYTAPATTIQAFLENKAAKNLPESSYPLGLADADFRDLLPAPVISPLQSGLKQFCKKLKAYETGIILGLESKTSSPVQVLRHPDKLFSTYENLFLAGEASGWSGGIISSAADGLRIAKQISG